MSPKNKDKNYKPTITNRKAAHEFFFIEKYTCGIVLTGTEIKSLREGKAQIQDAYCYFDKGELFIKNMEIAPYEAGSFSNVEPKRVRKLLLKKNELLKIQQKMEKGMTIIPIKIFFNERNYAKVEIALAKGKKLYDKRESIKEKEVKRSLQRIKNSKVL